jgi:hypothetical protein
MGRSQVADRRNDRVETSYELFNTGSWTEKKIRYSSVRIQLDDKTPQRSTPTFHVVLLRRVSVNQKFYYYFVL